MSISLEEVRDLIREAVQQPADDVLEKYVPAFANSFDPPLSAMTVFRWKRDGRIPPPTCTIQGTPYIKRSERLAALERLTQCNDSRPSCNPAAKKARGGV